MKKLLFFVLIMALTDSALLAQWSSDPAQNNAICDLAGEQAIPKVVTGPIGDTYIGWFSNDSGNYDVRLQRLDSSGNELWDHNGILISDNPAMSWLTDWDMTIDADNYAILTFQDIRNAGNNNVYAYRIAPDGTFVWGADGLELSNSTAFDVSPKVCITSTGNTVVTWQADTVVIMQKIAPDGTLLWGANGITLSCANTYSWPQPFAVEDDNILLKFFHDSGPPYAPTRHCYMQKFDTDGNAVWTSDTVVSNAGGITAWTQVFNIISDENNGCFISWHDSRGGGTISYPFVQHVNSDGSVAFTANGVQLSTEANRQNFYPESVYNAANDELITYWSQTDGAQNNHGITGQKLDTSGNLLWGTNGNNIISISSLYVLPFAVRQANDDVIILFEEYTDAVNAYVKAMRLDTDGNYVWPAEQVTMCSVASSKVHSEGSQFSNNQIIATWEDDRNGPKDIYAQNITFEGLLGVSDFGIVEGTVTEFGTGVPLEGATVSIVGTGLNATTLADGTYSITDILPGDYDITCVAPLYLDDEELGFTIMEGLNTLDFSMLWSEIAVDVTELICYLSPDTTGTQTFFITNNGPGDLVYSMSVEYTDELTRPENWLGVNNNPGTVPGNGGTIIVPVTFNSADLIVGDVLTANILIHNNSNYGGDYVIPVTLYVVSVGKEEDPPVLYTKLGDNYPNPFNPTTTISFSVAQTLAIFNIKGQKVKKLVDEILPAGQHSVIWNGTDENGNIVSSGVYFYKMKAEQYTSTKKMILVK